jgi:hypothetical protein
MTNERKAAQIGDAVVYVDAVGDEHQAVVTNVFGTTPASAINLVYVSGDESERDQYGRQIKRETSVVHQDSQSAHGRFWR